MAVSLWHKGHKKTKRVHVLVAHAFLGPPPDGHEVNHIDGVKSNPALQNLEYVTRSVNVKHAFDIGLKVAVRGERHGKSRLTRKAVLEMRRRRAAGVSLTALAGQFHVGVSTVFNVVARKTWAHVP